MRHIVLALAVLCLTASPVLADSLFDDYIKNTFGSDVHLRIHFDDDDIDDQSANGYSTSLKGTGSATEDFALVVDESYGTNPGGLNLTAEGDALTVTDSTEMANQDFTIMIWTELAFDPDTQSSDESWYFFRKGIFMAAGVTWDESEAELTIDFVLGAGSTATLAFEVVDESSIDLNARHLWVFTHDDSADEAKIYLDGELYIDDDTGTAASSYPFSDANWFFGAEEAGSPAVVRNTWLGHIDDVVVLDVVASAAQIEAAYEWGVEGDSFLRGDVNGDDSLDAADVSALGTYISTGVPSPYSSCWEAYDVDGDDDIDNDDYVYLTSYLFSYPTSGPPPPAPTTCGLAPIKVGDDLTCIDHGC